MNISNEAIVIDAQWVAQMKSWSHVLHQNPETAFEEVSSAQLVASVLRDLGCEIGTNQISTTLFQVNTGFSRRARRRLI
ncbi:MAG: hypothetical protein QOI13_2044 [Paraburkholderia sp.]|nr:hypothetical protein [Paraburkholderia sp.]